MMRRSKLAPSIILAFAVLAFIGLGWHQNSTAQSRLGGLKGGSSGPGKGAFQQLLSTHGDKAMMLEVHIRVAGPKIDKVEVLGKLVESTNAFLVVKMQNQRDLVFIPWEHVLWIQARPS